MKGIYHMSEEGLSQLVKSPGQAFNQALPFPCNTRLDIQSADYYSYYNRYFTDTFSNNKNVLVLPVQGIMTREGMYSYGMDMLVKCLASAEKDDNFTGVVLKFNTPGGTADGCAMFAEAIVSFTKPIVSFTNYCASAGYFAASQSDEIFIEKQSQSSIGSIGTIFWHENTAKQLENEGKQVSVFRASGSPDKARINGIEPLTEELKTQIQANVDAAQKEFVGYVKRGRMGKINNEEVFTGKMYQAEQAVKLGLADKTGSLDAAIKRAIQLSFSK